MRLNRFIGEFNFNGKNIRIDDFDLVNQFRKVLRFKPGDRVILGNGKMEEVLAEVVELNEKFIILKIIEHRLNKNELHQHGILYCSILKRENFELAAQKATEAGIKEIVPIVCQRTVKLDLKRERLEKIIKEASEQSGRGIVPVLHKALVLKQALEQAKQNDVNIFYDFSGKDIDGLKDILSEARKVGIFIGPEGGWGEEEVEMARDFENFKIFNLGKLSLKAETAAIVGSYVVIHS